jgi:predicted amino acid racemase
MPAPQLEIELDKIAYNARKQRMLYGSKGVRITAVIKGVCGSPRVAHVLLSAGIRSLGDSRLSNLRRLYTAGIRAQFVLIRSPMLSEAEQVVELADVSLNTEISVIRRLARYAAMRGKAHKIVLMVELGDLREGILPSDVETITERVMGLQGVKLIGIGTNLACLGGIKPTQAKMQTLSLIACQVERRFGITLDLVSGGNSANYQWFTSTQDVGRVNHLRIGESILLGCDTLTRSPIPGLHTDAFTLTGEVIELKSKPSRPYGQVAQDAFGHVPTFEDRGEVRRAILALGRQDVDVLSIHPRIDADIVGASSDHLILEVREPGLEVGATVAFDVGYAALLRAMTSPYVTKAYRPRFPNLSRQRARTAHGWRQKRRGRTDIYPGTLP